MLIADRLRALSTPSLCKKALREYVISDVLNRCTLPFRRLQLMRKLPSD